mgnify:CR=1 FL=1
MKLKTGFIGISLILAAFLALGCVNGSKELTINDEITKKNDKEKDLKVWYGIQSRFINKAVKEKLQNAKELDDFIDHYPVNWIKIYDSVVITIAKGEEKFSESGDNNVLNKAQLKLMSSLDYSDGIELNVYYKEKNAVTEKLESSHMRRSFTVVPKYEAECTMHYDSLIKQLTLSSFEKMDLSNVAPINVGPDSMEIPGPTEILFVINEKGKAENVRVGISSNDKKTDALLQQLITDMPLWKPAKDEEGKSVKQEFSFVVTESSFGWGC